MKIFLYQRVLVGMKLLLQRVQFFLYFHPEGRVHRSRVTTHCSGSCDASGHSQSEPVEITLRRRAQNELFPMDFLAIRIIENDYKSANVRFDSARSRPLCRFRLVHFCIVGGGGGCLPGPHGDLFFCSTSGGHWEGKKISVPKYLNASSSPSFFFFCLSNLVPTCTCSSSSRTDRQTRAPP